MTDDERALLKPDERSTYDNVRLNIEHSDPEVWKRFDRFARRLAEARRPFPMVDGPAVPWNLAERAYETYVCRYGKRQTLERIAARGGFGWDELRQLLIEAERKRQDNQTGGNNG